MMVSRRSRASSLVVQETPPLASRLAGASPLCLGWLPEEVANRHPVDACVPCGSGLIHAVGVGGDDGGAQGGGGFTLMFPGSVEMFTELGEFLDVIGHAEAPCRVVNWSQVRVSTISSGMTVGYPSMQVEAWRPVNTMTVSPVGSPRPAK